MQSQGYKSYQRVGISTADPVKLVVMLYEGAIKFLSQAMTLMPDDAIAASEKITRGVNIINHLRNTLDMNKGGEVAINLERLYVFMRDELAIANIRKDTEKIQHVINLLSTVLEGWRGICGMNTNPPPSEGTLTDDQGEELAATSSASIPRVPVSFVAE